MVKEQSIRWGMTGLSLLCLMGIGVYLAQFLWLFLAGVQQPEIQLNIKPVQSSVTQTQVVDVAQIQKWHLFGAPAKKQVVTEQPVEAPKTTLKLELLGVFLGQDGALSTAIIGEIGKSADYYKEGDTIARNGRYETLAFAEFTGSALGPVTSDSSASGSSSGQNFRESRRNFLRRSSRSSSRATSNAVPRSQLGRMVQSGKAFTPDKIVDALQQDLNQDPQAALQDMGLVSDSGGSGYVIGSNAPKDLLNTMGLRVGDRVMTVDGQAVSGGSSDSALIQSAMQKSNVQVEIQRGTRTFTVNVPVPK